MTMESISLQLLYPRCQQLEARPGNQSVQGQEEDISLNHEAEEEDRRLVLVHQNHPEDEEEEATLEVM